MSNKAPQLFIVRYEDKGIPDNPTDKWNQLVNPEITIKTDYDVAFSPLGGRAYHFHAGLVAAGIAHLGGDSPARYWVTNRESDVYIETYSVAHTAIIGFSAGPATDQSTVWWCVDPGMTDDSWSPRKCSTCDNCVVDTIELVEDIDRVVDAYLAQTAHLRPGFDRFQRLEHAFEKFQNIK